MLTLACPVTSFWPWLLADRPPIVEPELLPPPDPLLPHAATASASAAIPYADRHRLLVTSHPSAGPKPARVEPLYCHTNRVRKAFTRSVDAPTPSTTAVVTQRVGVATQNPDTRVSSSHESLTYQRLRGV